MGWNTLPNAHDEQGGCLARRLQKQNSSQANGLALSITYAVSPRLRQTNELVLLRVLLTMPPSVENCFGEVGAYGGGRDVDQLTNFQVEDYAAQGVRHFRRNT